TSCSRTRHRWGGSWSGRCKRAGCHCAVAEDDNGLRGSGPFHDPHICSSSDQILADQPVGRNSVNVRDRKPCPGIFGNGQRASFHSNEPGTRPHGDASGPGSKSEVKGSVHPSPFGFLTDLEPAHGNGCRSRGTVVT